MANRQFEDGTFYENGFSLVARPDGSVRKSHENGEDLAGIENIMLGLQMQAVRLERIYEALKSRKGNVNGRKLRDK